jgi:hypothetical protein
MKRLAAVAVMVAWFAMAAGAQRGGVRGGASASPGGFSGSHGGFSAPQAGFSSHSAPIFHGGMQAPVSPRVAGPSRYTTMTPYSARGFRPSGPPSAGPRPPYNSAMHRMPYHSPNGGDHNGGAHNGWNHNGWNHHDGDHDGYHHHGGFYNVYGGWGVPLWPGLGWGYPYLLPSYLDYPDSYDSQSDSSSVASQPYEDNGPYEAPPPAQYEAPPSGSYTSWPYGSQAAPSQAEPSSPVLEAPVILVFKDGRPPQQIHNYLLTATTLSVLDQRRQDIPVDQIDLAATAKVNRDAGVSFALPGGSR